MRDRTEGNTMAKVWRQVLESHCEEYLHRKDLYTTLLSQLNKPGGIISKSDLNDLIDALVFSPKLASDINALSCLVNRSFPSVSICQVNKIQLLTL